MRFDDMLATILAQPLATATARSAAWRQLVDIVAQRGGDPDPRAMALLEQLRGSVTQAMRAEAGAALARHRLPPALIAYFAGDAPAVAAPVLRAARLSAAEWIALLPTLGPTARALLRHRRDLDGEVTQALASFGSSDFALAGMPEPAETAPPAPPRQDDAQIRDLLARIDAFRRTAAAEMPEHEPEPEPEEPAPAEAAIEAFRFETDTEGAIIWVEDAPRGPLIGETIARAASGSDHGVDGHAAGAYRGRAPFRDARLVVAGAGAIGGEWRISAVPFFQPGDGRFGGYRGTARRPRAGESAAVRAVPEEGVYGSALPADSLRQLVHELRTPLNAIVGFAEMIERQLLGPAGSGYRMRAGDIVQQGRRLLAAVDDLDLAARVDSRGVAAEPGAVDAAQLLARLHADYDRVARERAAALVIRIAADLPAVAAEPVAVERMFARLLAATIGLAEPAERIAVLLDRDQEGAVRLTIARPRLIAGREERTLLDPGYTPDGDWPDAPVLGLGFALRLVRNLAAAAGGALDIEPDGFVLRLPAHGGAARAGGRS